MAIDQPLKRKRGRPAGSQPAKNKMEQKMALVKQRLALLDSGSSSSSTSSESESDKDRDDFVPMDEKIAIVVAQQSIAIDCDDTDDEVEVVPLQTVRPSREECEQIKLPQTHNAQNTSTGLTNTIKVSAVNGQKICASVQDNCGSAMARAKEVQAKLPAEHPSFVKYMLQSHVVRGFWLGLPSAFCNKHLPKHDTGIVLEDEDGYNYDTTYLGTKQGLSAGWRGFSIKHGIKVGDVVVFQLVRSTKFKVYIIRVNNFTTTDGALGLLNLEACKKGKISKEESSDDAKSKKDLKVIILSDKFKEDPKVIRLSDKVKEAPKVIRVSDKVKEAPKVIRVGDKFKEDPKVIRLGDKFKEDPKVIRVGDKFKEAPKVIRVSDKVKEDPKVIRVGDKFKEDPKVIRVGDKVKEDPKVIRVSSKVTHNDSNNLVSEAIDGIRFSDLDVNFDDVTSFSNFNIVMDSLVKEDPKVIRVSDKFKEAPKVIRVSDKVKEDPKVIRVSSKVTHNDSNNLVSEAIDGIRFSDSDVDFDDVTSFSNFNIVVDSLVIDCKFPDHLRKTYYELCCAQKSFLHMHLLKQLNLTLVVGVIMETINIAEGIRACKVHASSREDFLIWKKTLDSFELLGMNVAFLLKRVNDLLGLPAQSRDPAECEKYKEIKVERAHAGEKMKALESKLSNLKDALSKMDVEMEEMESSVKRSDQALQQIATAPW